MDIIQKFIEKMNYTNDESVEGIILYGSYQTNTYNGVSDVDIIVFYNNNSNRNIKGYLSVDGVEFEYYERTLKAYYERANDDYRNSEDTLLSAIGHGRILVDKKGEIIKLQQYILKVYAKALPKLDDNEIKYMAKSISKSISKLSFFTKTKCKYFCVYYCNVLEKIRIFYHKLNGFSNLTLASVYKIYNNKDLQKIQYKSMPGEKFINLYMSCLNVNNAQKCKYLKRIKKIYYYTIKDLNLDFRNMEIDLKNKNH